ncbi:MAG TPA: hypothetical protein ENN80_13035, partial [Candidatus Hydrogenedentes bacterium]|nr:hypothetical protein [Candidatus Hydrogenedentota bacterium]
MSDTGAECIACHGSDLVLFGPRAGYTYYECTACRTIQLVPLPTNAELDDAYRKDYAAARHISPDPDRIRIMVRNHYQAIVDALRAHPVTGKVLDYGAGWGGLCELLVENGYDAEAVELSDEMAAYGQRRGLPVMHGSMKDLAGKRYAALVMV